ncbi:MULTISPECIES: thiol reductant ABC exporter subunit CydC [Planomicrobium]|uniref:Thiol reductant ABC exporter subunit CydC n=1 Tax=Planomicrobium okeanokoites TaxID=244 RepID=A0ABV7KJE2_PLAOK|nr:MULTISPECIES: thiol reductant ABC exporter subunit CydC [Planomicrobium]PKH10818.1 thiol reductant ABC exporter subunit CydC [Planomicrobium sp. MB-3u-38]TAA68832.1 thiol reductant ABC exporter subunit CydC [Planomicrobium okeanokoites]
MSELTHVLKLTLREKRDVSLAIVFGVLAGLASVALLASSGYLISKAALTGQMTVLIVIGACLKLFGLGSAVSRYSERLFSHRATFTMLGNLRVSFFERLSPLAPELYSKYRSGDLLARIIGDVESLQNFLLRVFYPPVVLLLVFMGTILFTVYFSIYTAILLAIGYLLTAVAVPAYFAWRKRRRDWRTRESRGALSAEAAEFLYGFRDLKIHRQLAGKEQQISDLIDFYNEEQRNEGKEEVYSQSMNGFIALVISLAILASGAYFTAAGELDGLFLAMLVMISLGVFENMAPMAAFPSHFEESRKAAVRLDSIVDEMPRVKGSSDLPEGGLSISSRNLSYVFPDEQRPALDDVSIDLPRGSKTAIVGPSGSGKSTLLAVLMDILPARSGQVLINSANSEKFSQESIWQSLNVVLQENHFFQGTLRSNLKIADSKANDDQLAAALERVELGRFSLEMDVEEKGQNFSGGEKQRLAIARAILKKGEVWMLDEPVSSVDSATGQLIYERLFNDYPEQTFIIVSHDLTGLEKMDQIIVLENGKLMEKGSYDELMRSKGYFYGLKEIEQQVMA